MTTDEFVGAIWKRYSQSEQFNEKNIKQDRIEYGRRRGWLDGQDALFLYKDIDKKNASRIVHDFIRKELKEQDEADWNNAKKLKDIYDCHVCVNHVVQVVEKGIITPRQEDVFGMSDMLSSSEGNEIVERIFDVQLRALSGDKLNDKRKGTGTLHENGSEGEKRIIRLELKEALEMVSSGRFDYLIDLRSSAEYERRHLENARNISLSSILECPRQFGDINSVDIGVYCEKGYQSEIVAECLSENNYESVYYFAYSSN